jgi:hypothetical protein
LISLTSSHKSEGRSCHGGKKYEESNLHYHASLLLVVWFMQKTSKV